MTGYTGAAGPTCYTGVTGSTGTLDTSVLANYATNTYVNTTFPTLSYVNVTFPSFSNLSTNYQARLTNSVTTLTPQALLYQNGEILTLVGGTGMNVYSDNSTYAAVHLVRNTSDKSFQSERVVR